jgi:hypothetical protein
MSAPDIDHRPVLWAALAVAAIVATSIGVAVGLLHVWHEPLGGAASGGPSLLSSLQANGPALQSAPQADAAADRKARMRMPAASGATR